MLRLPSWIGDPRRSGRRERPTLWKGTNVAKFDDIVSALRDAGIPNYSRSGAKSEDYKPFFEIPYISAMMRMKRQMSWEVSVLESDYAKAREITAGWLT
jgi:hypothetical protein